MNFAECPDDSTRLKAAQLPIDHSKPLELVCPACGRHFTLTDDGIVPTE